MAQFNRSPKAFRRIEDVSPWHKVAVLMVALGKDLAGEIMRYLDEPEVEELTQALADLKSVPTALQDEILLEFEHLLRSGQVPLEGGMDFARQLLEQALGPEKARDLLARLEGKAVGFKRLNKADPIQVAPFIAQEHPQTIGLILSQLEPKQAAAILEQLPPSVQADVTHRIATLGTVAPELLREVEENVEAMLQDMMGGKHEVGGTKVAASILNLAGGPTEQSVLDRLDAEDPEVAEEIRKQMFVFDDIARLRDEDIRVLLQHVEVEELKVALRGASKAVSERMLSNMSRRRREMLEDDMAVMPPMRRSEVAEKQARIAQLVRQLDEQGVVRIVRDDDAYV
jgi:flagellar motor switch protein FliG